MSRLYATKILFKLINEKKSLSELKKTLNDVPAGDRSFVQELCYGVARWYFQLDFILNNFLQKPLKQKDADIRVLLLLGLYQLLFTRIPDHAAINETVLTARKLHKEWATKLVNGVLRGFIKKKQFIIEQLPANEVAYYAHPSWFIQKVKDSWPSWQEILQTNNLHPPLCLRINEQKITRQAYGELLTKAEIDFTLIPWTQNGLMLKKPLSVGELPKFKEGYVSVQDGAAQLAAEILAAKENDRVLDACAAPGGKACHILETQPKLGELIAVDNDANRLLQVSDNLNRLGLTAKILCHDVGDLSWWDGVPFDKILLDTPCSATGVIRRHPDIKLLREANDVLSLVTLQLTLLESVWQTLKPGGTLLYVTCSIFPEENEQLVKEFIKSHPNCYEEEIDAEWGYKVSVGRQILPGMHETMDGFYFAKIKKK